MGIRGACLTFINVSLDTRVGSISQRHEILMGIRVGISRGPEVVPGHRQISNFFYCVNFLRRVFIG